MEVCNTRNNYADRIWFHIKQQITKNEQGYCFYISDNLCYTIYHYITANKVLLNKNYYLSNVCCY